MKQPSPIKNPMKSAFASLTLWFGPFLLIILSSFYLSWKVLATADFLYPFWYQHIHIEQAIDRYAPENKYKHNFTDTNEAERFRLFSAILKAVQNQGEGLSEIKYHHPNGNPIDNLLTTAEIIHLQDVAKIITIFFWTGVASTLALFPALLLLRKKQIPMPKKTTLIGTMIVIFTAAGLAVLAIGPVDFFYDLHVRIFPDNHQWFFYYQESLMTTLMLAPTLFGYIALTWAITSFLLTTLILQGCHYCSLCSKPSTVKSAGLAAPTKRTKKGIK
ncbi:MAG: DUF1461 domain-containing protein [Pseudomonadales bacterium]|nr:DUF1461 domain-containing protein [Pseudomonadales bacterium]